MATAHLSWRQRRGLTALLGYCPLLAVADTLLKGLALGAATLAVLTGTVSVLGVARRWLTPWERLPACALTIAAVVTAVEFFCRTFLFELHLALGIYLPLIVANCAILLRAEELVSGERPGHSPAVDLRDGVVVLLLPALLGALRELIGRGSLFHGAPEFFGDGSTGLVLRLSGPDGGAALAVAPAGAFFALALLTGAWQALAARRPSR